MTQDNPENIQWSAAELSDLKAKITHLAAVIAPLANRDELVEALQGEIDIYKATSQKMQQIKDILFQHSLGFHDPVATIRFLVDASIDRAKRDSDLEAGLKKLAKDVARVVEENADLTARVKAEVSLVDRLEILFSEYRHQFSKNDPASSVIAVLGKVASLEGEIKNVRLELESTGHMASGMALSDLVDKAIDSERVKRDWFFDSIIEELGLDDGVKRLPPSEKIYAIRMAIKHMRGEAPIPFVGMRGVDAKMTPARGGADKVSGAPVDWVIPDEIGMSPNDEEDDDPIESIADILRSIGRAG